jgi:hypothetical protein
MPQCKNDNTKTYTGTEPGEKVLTFSSARLEKTQRVSSNEPYQAKLDKLASLSTTKNQPSPKGLGYCAHNENLYKIMVGLDNNYWYVSPVGKSRRWKHLKIPSGWFQDIKNIKSKIIKKIIKGRNYNDIIVLYNEPKLEKTQRVSSNEPYQATVDKRGSLAMPKNKPYDVYRNKAFEKEIKSITKLNFNFSEQGLQEVGKAHMELDNISIIKLIKKYMS